MDRERWIKVGLEIADHLEEIQRIIARNGMDQISMAVFRTGFLTATYIDDSETQWSADKTRYGYIKLSENQDPYYTRT